MCVFVFVAVVLFSFLLLLFSFVVVLVISAVLQFWHNIRACVHFGHKRIFQFLRTCMTVYVYVCIWS